jgi:hypothetical protein
MYIRHNPGLTCSKFVVLILWLLLCLKVPPKTLAPCISTNPSPCKPT